MWSDIARSARRIFEKKSARAGKPGINFLYGKLSERQRAEDMTIHHLGIEYM
jgi:hypothetical protein